MFVDGPHSPIGRGSGLKIRQVSVRVRLGAPHGSLQVSQVNLRSFSGLLGRLREPRCSQIHLEPSELGCANVLTLYLRGIAGVVRAM
jgi:hypothetical protein